MRGGVVWYGGGMGLICFVFCGGVGCGFGIGEVFGWGEGLFWGFECRLGKFFLGMRLYVCLGWCNGVWEGDGLRGCVGVFVRFLGWWWNVWGLG